MNMENVGIFVRIAKYQNYKKNVTNCDYAVIRGN